MFKQLSLTLTLLASVTCAASLLGVPGPGRMTESPDVVHQGLAGAGEAMVDKVSYSTRAPARNAFNDKTAFSFGARLENTQLVSGSSSEAISDFSFGTIGLGTPIGFLGALSLSYQPMASRNVEFETERGKNQLTGSLQELVLSWSFRVPFQRKLSLGVTWREALGIERTSLQWELSAEEREKINANSRVDLEQKIQSSGGRPALSLFWLGRKVSLSAWWSNSFELERTLDRSVKLVELMGIYGYSAPVYLDDRPGAVSAEKIEKWEQSMPWNGGAALSLRLTRTQSLHLDFHQESWSTVDGWRVVEPFGTPHWLQLENARRISLGWAYEGSNRSFDSIWKRSKYRVGARWATLEMPGVEEAAGALGASHPLGRRGALIDWSIEAGRRYSNDGENADENFVALSLGLTGLGQWGQPSRRR